MEQISQARSWPRWECRIPSLTLLVVFVVLVGLIVLTLGAAVLARATLPPSNLFASFADVFPGQLRSAAVAQGFSCGMSAIDDYHDSPEDTCILRPEAGAFSQIEVFTFRGAIRRLTFRLRENTLTLGDLTLLWGTPEIRNYGRSTILDWSDCGIIAFVPDIGRYSHFSLVWSVQVTDAAICPL